MAYGRSGRPTTPPPPPEPDPTDVPSDEVIDRGVVPAPGRLRSGRHPAGRSDRVATRWSDVPDGMLSRRKTGTLAPDDPRLLAKRERARLAADLDARDATERAELAAGQARRRDVESAALEERIAAPEFAGEARRRDLLAGARRLAATVRKELG